MRPESRRRKNGYLWLRDTCILCKMERNNAKHAVYDYQAFSHRVYHAWEALHWGEAENINAFLKDLVPSWRSDSEERRSFLRGALSKELDKGFSRPGDNPPPWWGDDSTNPKGYLYEAVKSEAERMQRDQEVGDKPWGRQHLKDEKPPDQCEFIPGMHDRTDEDPAKELEMFQQLENSRAALRRFREILPERQYQAVTLRASGLTHNQIAAEMNVTPGAVKQQLFRASNNPALRKAVGD